MSRPKLDAAQLATTNLEAAVKDLAKLISDARHAPVYRDGGCADRKRMEGIEDKASECLHILEDVQTILEGKEPKP